MDGFVCNAAKTNCELLPLCTCTPHGPNSTLIHRRHTDGTRNVVCVCVCVCMCVWNCFSAVAFLFYFLFSMSFPASTPHTDGARSVALESLLHRRGGVLVCFCFS